MVLGGRTDGFLQCRDKLFGSFGAVGIASINARFAFGLGQVKRAGFQGNFAEDKGVVGVTVSTMVSACAANRAKFLSSRNNMVQLVPVFGARMHPGGFVLNLVWKERAGSTKVVVAT